MTKKKKPFLTHTFRYLRGPWSDVDYKMLHACFNFLEDYVEKEKGLKDLKAQYDLFKGMDTKEKRKVWGISTDRERKKAERVAKHNYEEVKELYTWWKEYYVKNFNSGNWDSLSPEFDKEEQEMLIRLIKIRRILWT